MIQRLAATLAMDGAAPGLTRAARTFCCTALSARKGLRQIVKIPLVYWHIIYQSASQQLSAFE